MNSLPGTSGTEAKFKWYEIVPPGEPLQQGDLLDGFPIIIPPILTSVEIDESEGQLTEVDTIYERFNVIVMTQSCDLENCHDDDSPGC